MQLNNNIISNSFLSSRSESDCSSQLENKSLQSSKFYSSSCELLNLFDKYSRLFTNLNEKFTNNALAPFKLFYESMSNIYEECMNEYRQIIISSSESKKNLDKLKNKYYEAVSKMEEVKNILETRDEAFSIKFSGSIANNYKYYYQRKAPQNKLKNMSENSINNNITQDIYIRLNSQVQILAEHLKYEVHKFNVLCEKNYKIYLSIIEKIKNNEDSRISFVHSQESKFSKFFSNIGQIFLDLGKDLDEKSEIALDNMKATKLRKNKNSFISSSDNIKNLNNLEVNISPSCGDLNCYIDQDKELIDDSIFSYFSKINFSKENYQSIVKFKNKESKKNTNNERKGEQIDKFKIDKSLTKNHLKTSSEPSLEFIHYGKLNKKENFLTIDEEQNILIENFWNAIVKDKEIDLLLVRDVIRLLSYKVKAGRILFDIILGEKKFLYVKLLNLNNLYHLANVMNTITIMICLNDMKEDEELIFAVIYISERIYHEIKDQSNIIKTYLCSIVSQNCTFLNNKFWKKLFEKKFFPNLESEIKKIYPKLMNIFYQNNNNANNELANKKSLHSEETEYKIGPNKTYSMIYVNNAKDNLKLEEDNLDKNSYSSDLIERPVNKLISFGNKLKNFFSSDDKKDTQNKNENSNLDPIYKNLANNIKEEKKAFPTLLPKSSQIFDINYFEGVNLNDTVPAQPLHKFLLSELDKSLIEKVKNSNEEKNFIENLSFILSHPDPIQYQLIERTKIDEASKILKSFINHFANFNFDISDAIDFVVEICTYLNFPNETLSLFVTLINTSTYSIRNKNNISCTIKSVVLKNLKTKNDNKLFSLLKAKDFLDNKEILNLSMINKNVYKKIIQNFYTDILSLEEEKINSKIAKFSESKDKEGDTKSLNDENFSSINKRLIIWQHSLKMNQMKLNVSYEKTVELVEKMEVYIKSNKEEVELTEDLMHINTSDIKDNFNIINLDVARTYFKNNANENRNSVKRILKGFVIYQNCKCYCQGMNYIVAFLLMLWKSEEKAFYAYISLFNNTEFGIVFNDDLAKLKQFFYVFDRLLILFTPELNSYFFHNNIGSSYYCSPWFMTLFTNCYQVLDEQISLVLLKIWDEFLVNGWKAMLKTGIVLLMTYEDVILSLKYEETLNFLFNDVLKTGFFSNDNYLKFVDIWNRVSFPQELLNNLENEHLQNSKVNEQTEKLDKLFGFIDKSS